MKKALSWITTWPRSAGGRSQASWELGTALSIQASATTLLGMTSDAPVLSGSINLTDVGAAMLRGFDIPAYRKDIQREIRKTKEVPSIEEFGSTWLHQMSNAVRTLESSFREILELGGEDKGGILPMHVASTEELLEVAATA